MDAQTIRAPSIPAALARAAARAASAARFSRELGAVGSPFAAVPAESPRERGRFRESRCGYRGVRAAHLRPADFECRPLARSASSRFYYVTSCLWPCVNYLGLGRKGSASDTLYRLHLYSSPSLPFISCPSVGLVALSRIK